MRCKLRLDGISLFYAVLWCRQNSIPIVLATSFKTGPTKWIGKVFFFGSRRIIKEGLGRIVRDGGSFYYVVLRREDFDIVKLRFGTVEDSWF